MSDNEPITPDNAKVVPRFSGLSTFGRVSRVEDVGSFENVDVAVVGIPFDGGTSYRPGARFGPAHIRQSSRLLRPYNFELDTLPFDSQQVVDAGDIPCNPFSIQESIKSIEQGMGQILAGGAKPLVLGGDHTIALPMLRSLAAVHGPISVIHFDAHLDTNDNYFGERYTHGTPFRRAHEEGLLNTAGCVHVGTRGPQYPEEMSDDQAIGFQVITSFDVGERGARETVDRLLARTAGTPVYVSVDIDVLDPAHAPGTGTPEAGGITSRELLAVLRGLGRADLVGADIVEVAPAYDHAEITGIAAAHVGFELLSAFSIATTTEGAA